MARKWPRQPSIAVHAHEAAAEVLYSNPLPHVLMLTAIVVGIATTALALAIVIRIQQEYGTVEEDELVVLDLEGPAPDDRVNEHLPILQVAVPLVAAPLCLFFAQTLAGARVWRPSFRGARLASALSLLRSVWEDGAWSYALGGWPPPIGIEYRITLAGAFVLVAVSGIASVVLLFDTRGGESRLHSDRAYLFYAAYLLCLAGLLGMTATGDAFNTFVFLEISSLASYSLIAMGPGRRSLMAAYSYLIMGTIGGAFVMLGIGALYHTTGTLNLQDLAVRLVPLQGSRTVGMGFAFLVVGLSIKLAVFPLHQWLPNAYSYAPSKVSAFLAGTATKVSYLVLVRLVYTVFGAGFVFGVNRLELLLLPLSIAAMFVASLAAIYQHDLKRMLAYSSIAQVGYMTLGLSLNNQDGLTGGLVHLFNHGLMKSGLFLVMAAVVARYGRATLDEVAGLGRKMPLVAAAFVLGGLSMIGVPGTVGFVSKWFLVVGALERGYWWLALLILLSSLLAVVYVWRVVEAMYFREPAPGAKKAEAPVSMLLPIWTLVGATVVFGVWAALTSGVAREAAARLIGAGV